MAPWRTARARGPSTHTVSPPFTRKRPTRSEAVRSSWQETVISGRRSRQAMCSMKRVLPQPVGPLSSTGRPLRQAASKTAISSPTGS